MYGRDYDGGRSYADRGWNARDYDVDYTYGGYARNPVNRGYGANRGTTAGYGGGYNEPRSRSSFGGYNNAGFHGYNSAGYGGYGYDRDFGYNDRVTFRTGGDRMRGYGNERDVGDRLREGWHDLKRGVRRMVGGGYDRGWR